jgi:hypothetical protein
VSTPAGSHAADPARRQVGESYKDYADRIYGMYRALRLDMDILLVATRKGSFGKSQIEVIGDFLNWCGLEGYALVHGDRVLDLEGARAHYERTVNEFLDSSLGDVKDWKPAGILPFLEHPDDRDGS